MNTFEVFKLFPITIESAKGLELTDSEGKKYLDPYGGHGVISIGHCQEDYVKAITAHAILLIKRFIFNSPFRTILTYIQSGLRKSCKGL